MNATPITEEEPGQIREMTVQSTNTNTAEQARAVQHTVQTGKYRHQGSQPYE
jgi:hypothetical protein